MNFRSLQKQFKWKPLNGQKDKYVTYIIVSKKAVWRLVGTSDILYIGQTKQSISKRYNQEINTYNTVNKTQNTNIRMTHILTQLNLDNITCYFIKDLEFTLQDKEKKSFVKNLRTWDNAYFIKNFSDEPPKKVNIEKFLLVNYAAKHLELPPLNNSF